MNDFLGYYDVNSLPAHNRVAHKCKIVIFAFQEIAYIPVAIACGMVTLLVVYSNINP